MNPMHKKAFTLTEILVVLVIMGFLVSLVLPRFSDTIDFAGGKMNKAQMQEIKRASLEFYDDVGFVADNVTLLTYPWENCDVEATNFDDPATHSDLCINMIAFIDRHYKFTTADPALRTAGMGDNGNDTQRTQDLIDVIEERLNPDRAWRGSYIGGNSVFTNKNIKTLGGIEAESNNQYFFSDIDIDIYYEDFNNMQGGDTVLSVVDTSWDATRANNTLYPIHAVNFSVEMDNLYENAKYSKDDGGRTSTFLGASTILDPYGTPYEIQIPTAAAVGTFDHDDNAGTAEITRNRTQFARIVSFGEDRRRDTDINTLNIDFTADGYDDSVLYIFSGHGLQNHFHPEDEEQ